MHRPRTMEIRQFRFQYVSSVPKMIIRRPNRNGRRAYMRLEWVRQGTHWHVVRGKFVANKIGTFWVHSHERTGEMRLLSMFFVMNFDGSGPRLVSEFIGNRI